MSISRRHDRVSTILAHHTDSCHRHSYFSLNLQLKNPCLRVKHGHALLGYAWAADFPTPMLSISRSCRCDLSPDSTRCSDCSLEVCDNIRTNAATLSFGTRFGQWITPAMSDIFPIPKRHRARACKQERNFRVQAHDRARPARVLPSRGTVLGHGATPYLYVSAS